MASDNGWTDAEHINDLEAFNLPLSWIKEKPPEPEFAINLYLPKKAVSLLVAAGGVGKSLIALDMTVAIATGKNFLGQQVNASKVAYMSLEDPPDQIRYRLYKYSERHDENLLHKNILLIDRYGKETHVAINVNGEIKLSRIPGRLVELLSPEAIDVLIIDTFIRSHSVNENDNAQMAAVMVAYEKLATELKCAVLLLHHVPKSAATDGKSTKSSHLARGASAITDNARSSIIVEPVSDREGKTFIDIEDLVEKKQLLKITHRKHNYSAKAPDQYLQIVNGTIRPFTPIKGQDNKIEMRYRELQEWWKISKKGKPLFPSNIDSDAPKIRPQGSSYGKKPYKEALSWAIERGHAKEVKTNQKNPKARGYVLHPIS